MKQFILRLIYNLSYWIDEKKNKIEYYSYETAPYCGHHHNGHDGWLTRSHYHEGDGICESYIFKRLGLVIFYCNVDKRWFTRKFNPNPVR